MKEQMQCKNEVIRLKKFFLKLVYENVINKRWKMDSFDLYALYDIIPGLEIAACLAGENT
jgi:hypothetical protein